MLGDFMRQRVAALVRDTCGEFFQDAASSEQVLSGRSSGCCVVTQWGGSQ